MNHIARFAMTFAVVFVLGVGSAHAQTPTAAKDSGYVEVTFGPTFGHTSSGSVGAEVGYAMEDFGFFGEGGRMMNIASSDIDAKGKIIADALGATATAKQPTTYFDGGVVKAFSAMHGITPYALFGVGGATVSNKVTFAVSGTDITGQLAQRGVQLGADLSGNYTKLFITFGVGGHLKLGNRLMVDVSYRYGRVGANTVSENKAINSSRLQFGVGAKF